MIIIHMYTTLKKNNWRLFPSGLFHSDYLSAP